MIPPTLSDSEGEVCNKEQEPPLPGAAGIAGLNTGNAQTRFPLESPNFVSGFGRPEHTDD